MGVDIGGTNLKIGLFDRELKFLDFNTYALNGEITPGDVILIIKDRFEVLSKKYHIKSLACGLPGLIDYERGYIHSLTNLVNWDDVDFKKMLVEAVGVPIFIDNDVNLAALAEYHFGSGKGCSNMLMVALGTGVGGGLILNGEVYRGCNNAVAEVGHIQLSTKGPKCSCGNRGCLESYVGNRRLIGYLKRRLKYSKSILNKIDFTELKLEDVTRAAILGDKFSIEFWDYAASKLTQALVGVVNVLNLEKIVIGGGVSNAGESLFKPLRGYLKEQAMDIQAKSVKIVKARFKDRSGVIGAGLLGRDNLI